MLFSSLKRKGASLDCGLVVFGWRWETTRSRPNGRTQDGEISTHRTLNNRLHSAASMSPNGRIWSSCHIGAYPFSFHPLFEATMPIWSRTHCTRCQKPLGLFVLLAIQQATHCFLSLQPLKPLLIQQQLVIFWNNRQLDAHQYTITMTRFQRTSSVRWACDLHLADVLLKTGVWWRRLLPGQFGRQCPQHLYRFSTLQRPGLDWALQVVGKQQDMLFSLLLLPSILLVMTILNGALSVEHLSFAENGCVLENHSMEQAYRTIGL